MSTIEDFENAPVGATATHKATGSRVVKIGDDCWMIQTGAHVGDELMTRFGYTLDPPAPTTAREALDLAWELAHEVKEGQIIPEGAELLEVSSSGLREYTAQRDYKVSHEVAPIFRTLEPLPEPLPEWLDAPAVLTETCWCPQGIWLPETGGHWKCTGCRVECHWSDLRDVTPLYPKEGQDS